MIALSILPSCTTEPADEASEASEVGLTEDTSDVTPTEEPADSEDVRQGAIVDDGPIPILDCGLTPYSDRQCYYIRNCDDHVIHRRIVKYGGSKAACSTIPAGSVLGGCLANGRVSHMEGC